MAGRIKFPFCCPNGHMTQLDYDPEELRTKLKEPVFWILCAKCGESFIPTEEKLKEITDKAGLDEGV